MQAVGISGGIAGNVIPDRCVVTVNYRYAPDKSGADAVAYVRGVFDGFDVQVQDNRSLRWLADRRTLTSQTRDQDFGLTVYGGDLQAVIEPTDWLEIPPAWRLDRVAGYFPHRLAGTTAPVAQRQPHREQQQAQQQEGKQRER